MPEQSKVVISGYQNEKDVRKNYQKLAKKITDVVVHKIGGVSANDPEYWGLREMLTPEMVDMCNKMKLRKHYTLDDPPQGRGPEAYRRGLRADERDRHYRIRLRR